MKVLVIDDLWGRAEAAVLRRIVMRGTGRTTRMILRAILAAEHQDVVVVLQYHQQIPAAAMTICRIFPQSVYRTHNRTVTIANHTVRFITPSDEGFNEWKRRPETHFGEQPIFIDHEVLDTVSQDVCEKEKCIRKATMKCPVCRQEFCVFHMIHGKEH